MRKNAMIVFLVIVSFILVGCGTEDLEKADSIEDVAGAWKRVGGSIANYCQYYNDGTYGCDEDLERVNNKTAEFNGEYWFEDAQYFDNIGTCRDDGVYEINIQSDGNLKFVLIEDECPGRVSNIVGSFSSEGLIEWERVP